MSHSDRPSVPSAPYPLSPGRPRIRERHATIRAVARVVLLLPALLLASFVARAEQDSPPSESKDDAPVRLNVLSFNLRYASPVPPNAWQDRREAARDVILSRGGADVVGTQEGLYHQLRDLAADLPDYEWIGLGRDGGSKGEFMAVFYRRDRLEPMAFDHFWLSDKPREIGSRTWGANLPRMVTRVLFREKATGRRFHFWNTHFDHQSEPSRRKSAELLLREIRAAEPRLPTIVTGDFNQSQGSEVHATLLAEPPAPEPAAEGGAPQAAGPAAIRLSDAWDAAERRVGEQVGTFHGFKGPNPTSTSRIDWILLSPEVRASSIEVVVDARDGQYPSDHFPVHAVLELVP